MTRRATAALIVGILWVIPIAAAQQVPILRNVKADHRINLTRQAEAHRSAGFRIHLIPSEINYWPITTSPFFLNSAITFIKSAAVMPPNFAISIV